LVRAPRPCMASLGIASFDMRWEYSPNIGTYQEHCGIVTRLELTGGGNLRYMADDGLPADLRERVETAISEQQELRERDRYFECPVCSQRVDRQDFRAVLHHDERPHGPL